MRVARFAACLLLLPLVCCAPLVRDMVPDEWASLVGGHRRWIVYFALQGCTHCERLAPMMEALAGRTDAASVGRVDASTHNGLARTFGVQKFPTILLFERGLYYEYHGRRSLPRLQAFIAGDAGVRGAGVVAPTALQPNVSEWWLLAEMLWPPIRTSLAWATGLALAIKGLSLCLLRLLQRGRTRRPSDDADDAPQPPPGSCAADAQQALPPPSRAKME
jgi:thiol-disulfide isomerase/thioredoxin